MVHWVTEGKPCEVWVPEGEELLIREGLLESNADVKVDDVVQFERFGFVRIDEVKDGKVRAIFAHK
ncbi:MAG: glutamate--tRNA ligase, partial [Thermococcus sp.]